jgi:uroporphyrinogen-III synthase
MRLLVTRPAEEGERLAGQLRAQGHRPALAPLMEIKPVPGAVPDLSSVCAILVTSRNGVRALAATMARRDLPVLAVGASTADAARVAGFNPVLSANGDVASLAALAARTVAPDDGILLHAAGRAVAGDLAGMLPAYRIRRTVLYEAQPLPRLPEAARQFLEAGEPGGVLLYSPRTAALFAALAAAEGLAASAKPLTAFCLSAAVADAARPLGFGRLAIAPEASQAALLALIPLEPGRDPS